MQNKAKVLLFDNIVDICCDFYSWDEIAGARNVLYEHLVTRLTKYKDTVEEKCKKSTIDLVKKVFDPELNLPMFCAVNLDRLPPVGVEHIDASALLREVSALRSEVRLVTSIRTELANMRNAVQQNIVSTSTSLLALCVQINEDSQVVSLLSSPTICRQSTMANIMKNVGDNDLYQTGKLFPVIKDDAPRNGSMDKNSTFAKTVVCKWFQFT